MALMYSPEQSDPPYSFSCWPHHSDETPLLTRW